MAKTVFETETCGRCGGSGRFSFNLMDGDRCYGCGGTGWKHTKRGRVASAWFRDAMKTKVADLEPGFKLLNRDGLWWEIVSIETSRSRYLRGGEWKHYVDLNLKRGKKVSGRGEFPDGEVTAVPNFDHHRALLKEAAEYEGTLTKAGKPRKRRAKAAAAS